MALILGDIVAPFAAPITSGTAIPITAIATRTTVAAAAATIAAIATVTAGAAVTARFARRAGVFEFFAGFLVDDAH